MDEQIKKKIEDLQNRRYEYIREEEKTYDPSTGQYKKEYIEIQELSKEIIQLLYTHQEILAMEFILEQLTMLGQAPSVIYDDNGHFSVTQPVYGTTSIEENPVDTEMYFAVEKEEFANGIRDALRKYMEKIKE